MLSSTRGSRFPSLRRSDTDRSLTSEDRSSPTTTPDIAPTPTPKPSFNVAPVSKSNDLFIVCPPPSSCFYFCVVPFF